MKNVYLDKEQVKELRAAHNAERNRNAAYKINAVIIGSDGHFQNEKQDEIPYCRSKWSD
ncbi:MAG: hypothetical protein GXP08_04055 [Gammaproteobacteria bacterium]|nr:hypothetical protein [Gammaproteobacteria bacterium]